MAEKGDKDILQAKMKFFRMEGYLTVKSTKPLFDGNSYCQVCIPNREIYVAYEKEILAKLDTIIPMSFSISVQQALLSGDSTKLEQEKLT